LNKTYSCGSTRQSQKGLCLSSCCCIDPNKLEVANRKGKRGCTETQVEIATVTDISTHSSWTVIQSLLKLGPSRCCSVGTLQLPNGNERRHFGHNLLPMELITANVNKTYSSRSTIQYWVGLCLSKHSWKDPKKLEILNAKAMRLYKESNRLVMQMRTIHTQAGQ